MSIWPKEAATSPSSSSWTRSTLAMEHREFTIPRTSSS